MTLPTDLPSVDDQRAQLRHTDISADRTYRVLFVGQFVNGPTDVVASLLRALENVGHTVFHWDPLRHPATLRNPHGAIGGYGPLLLQLPPMRAALDTFRPQVLVLCANGMVLDETTAAELRERGIVTIGVTLSDPDVLPSVIDHVGVLDYHTTNSEVALRRYHEDGLRNTLLLPFGIDRDYVLQRVPPDPHLRTQVTCIGHAPERFDRHAVMRRLAAEFDVRVYGQGWPFPGAEPVQGQRLVQAAREATFHVNFPATRAGYVNVKCGAFETVGAGAILCTAEFDEMRRFFTYGEEILGYSDAEDLAAAIRTVAGDPERVEVMRRRSFGRLLAEHLYERRWLDLFADIDADLADPQPAVGAARAAEIRAALAQTAPRPRVVVVSGFYGAGNLGDDLILDSIAAGIERDVPDAMVAVACRHPMQVERDQGRPAFDRGTLAATDAWAGRASAVVLGGGGLWHDYSIDAAGGASGLLTGADVSPAHFAQLGVLAAVHRAPLHVFGMGVGPLDDGEARDLVRFSGSLAASVVVRDEASRDLLRGLDGWVGEVEVAPDAVYAAPLPDGYPGAEPAARLPARFVALNVRPWAAAGDDIERVVGRVVDVARRRGLGIVGFPMMGGDESLLSSLLGAADLPGGVHVLGTGTPVGERLTALAAAEAVVAMRLHTCLLAHRLGRPAVGIAYDPKVAHHFAEVGRADRAVPLGREERVADLLSAALDEEALPGGTRAAVSRLEAGATQALATLAARLAAAPVRRPPVGRILPSTPKAATAAVPPGWSRAEVVALSAVETVAAGPPGTDREVPVRGDRLPGYVAVRFAGVPRRGDMVGLRLAVPTDPGAGFRMELWVQERHPEAVSARGRLAYEVVLDGQVLLREDAARWRPRNTVWLAWRAAGPTSVVELRLVALRDLDDCERWVRSRGLRLEAVRMQPWRAQRGVAVSASSPFSEPATRPARTAPAASAGVRSARPRRRTLRRVVRKLRR